MSVMPISGRRAIPDAERSGELLRILVVDDHPDARLAIRLRLEREGIFETDEAGDGDSALEAIRAHSPIVAVVDFRMPGMDGLELTRRIKMEFPEVDVIGLTAFDDPSMRQKMVEAGASDILMKSELGELMKALKQRATTSG
jgi:two-component system, NarL family, response regulator